MEITEVVPQAEDVESTAPEEFNAPRQSSRSARRDAWLRRALLAVIALSLTWLALTIRSSILEIDSEVAALHAKILSWHE